MDEPTNDLDLETLELLEELLGEYPGTLLLVSHDREFLNNVVTSTLALEGEGRVKEYAGGYDDWLRQRPAEPPPVAKPPRSGRRRGRRPARPRRLTYMEQRELEALPPRIRPWRPSWAGSTGGWPSRPSIARRPAEIVRVKRPAPVAPGRVG